MVAPVSPTKVLVTGVNGFIGLHTTLRLLQLGCCVRGTMRREAYKRKTVETLSKQIDTSNLEFALADLSEDDGWKDAIQSCSFVIHIASPYPAQNSKDVNELVIPAREGTLRVLRAAQMAGVKRVVMLSTIGAIMDGHQGENRTFDETDWSDLEKTRLFYHISKTLAERAAWDFIHRSEHSSKMELVVINASNVFGPVLDDHHHSATEWYRTIMHAEVPGVARTQLDFVDVRDLVDVLVKALTIPGAAGRRFICNGASISMLEFANILHQNFSGRGYRIPNRILPDWMVRLIALFLPKVRSVARQLQWKYTFSTEQSQLIFGWQPRPYPQTIVDMADSLIKFGLV